MGDDRSRRAVEVAERYADGLADDTEIIAARREALRVAETLASRAGRSNLPLAVQPPVDQADVEIVAARAAVEATCARNRPYIWQPGPPSWSWSSGPTPNGRAGPSRRPGRRRAWP